jgi:hypothetical protein
MLSDEKLKQLAEYILLGETEDVEFLSVWEIMDDQLSDNQDYQNLSQEEQHELALKIDRLIRSAVVTVQFPEDCDGS